MFLSAGGSDYKNAYSKCPFPFVIAFTTYSSKINNVLGILVYQICYILYPGDESIEGKVLRLKQQYTLCSASLQDIIARFERRSGASVKFEEFPEKVAVQMNDTHPTLCIPELMRILIDLKGLSWKEAWNITQRYRLFVSAHSLCRSMCSDIGWRLVSIIRCYFADTIFIFKNH